MAGKLIKKDGILEKGNLRIPFQIIRSSRKTLAVQVKADGQVVIRVPLRTSWKEAERFLERESAWVERHVAVALASYVEPRTYTDAQVREGKARAGELFARRTAHFSAVMGVDYGRISVRQQKPRWGSCSVRGNLNFNWKLALMPEEILDYVVVHELAHRVEMNHSPRFWAVVETVLPDWRERRRWLKQHGGEY